MPEESAASRAAKVPSTAEDPAALDLFYEAARAGDVEALQNHIKSGIDIDAATARLVLDQRDGYRVETGPATAMLLAANNSHFDAVDVLVCAGADLDILTQRGDSALHRAVARQAGDIVRYLLLHGAQTNPPMPEFSGLTGTALHTAAIKGDPEIVAALLEAGADADAMAMGLTPLDAAANDEVASLLRAASSLPVKAERDLATLTLHDAVIQGSEWQVRRLLERGDDPEDLGGFDDTPISFAASRGNRRIVELLLEAGAEVNTRDDNIETPLIRAVLYDRAEIVELLLEHGADPTASDFRGRPAIEVAKSERVRAALREALPVPDSPADMQQVAAWSALLLDIEDERRRLRAINAELARMVAEGGSDEESREAMNRLVEVQAAMVAKTQAARKKAEVLAEIPLPSAADCATYLELVESDAAEDMLEAYVAYAEGFSEPMVEYDICSARSFDGGSYRRFLGGFCRRHPDRTIQDSVHAFICGDVGPGALE